MGDFSRDTFDRLKHYVGVRLQQGVPLVDADWNELEDIRRYEVQAFLKWFVGDGVPAGNDGFHIAPLAGGGVGTIRLTTTATGAGAWSVDVDVAASTAAAVLGFTALNHRAVRSPAAARLTGEAAEPFALTAGMTLVLSVNGGAAQTVTFQAGSATAAQVVSAINAVVTGVTAAAGTGDDFTITGGNGTPEGAGRCLVDGRDAVLEGRLAYSAQPLFGNPTLAGAWGVPTLDELAAPPSVARNDLVYLDVWDREVTSTEDTALVNNLIGVETAVRVRREWVVRVRPGSGAVPVSTDPEFRAGHSYLPLAQLARQPATPAITATALTDLRSRDLLMAPSVLVQDMLGRSAADYRRGLGRPALNLRDTVNALLSGRLPVTDDIAAAPGTGVDTLGRASVVDATNGLVAIWQSPRNGGVNQIVASRLDPAHPEVGFGAVSTVSSTGVAHFEPAGVLLPTGEILVAYQDANFDLTGTVVRMKRATLANLPGATETVVASTASLGNQSVRAVLSGDEVVFLTQQVPSNASNKVWQYRRYRHTDSTFLDTNPVNVPPATQTGQRDLHAAGIGTVVWLGYADGTNLRVARMTPVPASGNPFDPATFDQVPVVAAASALDVFVLPLTATDALVFYRDGGGLSVAAVNSGGATPGTLRLPDTDASEVQPVAVRDADGAVYLATSHTLGGGASEILLRRRHPITGQWGAPQRIGPGPSSNVRPHLTFVPNAGLWLLWTSTKGGTDLDLFAKRIITAI
ncbi:MAG: DUF6519 domain-containing protein [Mycobacteriales bacterium]